MEMAKVSRMKHDIVPLVREGSKKIKKKKGVLVDYHYNAVYGRYLPLNGQHRTSGGPELSPELFVGMRIDTVRR